ncbi:hypothetical protein E2320_015251 [Naja naja]|nr:hypothetical protein E2320_015251 [Naja naja]
MVGKKGPSVFPSALPPLAHHHCFILLKSLPQPSTGHDDLKMLSRTSDLLHIHLYAFCLSFTLSLNLILFKIHSGHLKFVFFLKKTVENILYGFK